MRECYFDKITVDHVLHSILCKITIVLLPCSYFLLGILWPFSNTGILLILITTLYSTVYCILYYLLYFIFGRGFSLCMARKFCIFLLKQEKRVWLDGPACLGNSPSTEFPQFMFPIFREKNLTKSLKKNKARNRVCDSLGNVKQAETRVTRDKSQ